jgi:hypothetical protein
VNVNTYALSASGQTSGNYALSYVDGTLGVSKAPLTITASDAAKTYDGLPYSGGNGVTYTGFVNGEGVSVLGGSVVYGGTAQGAVNVNTYALSASGQASGNYTLSYVDGTLGVAKAPLTITASDAAKTYDGLAYSGGNGVTYIGFVNGEDASVLGGSVVYGGTAQGAVGLGTYGLSVEGIISPNYTITFGSASLVVAAGQSPADPIPYLLPPVKSKPFLLLTNLPDSAPSTFEVGGLNYVHVDEPLFPMVPTALALIKFDKQELGILTHTGTTLLVKNAALTIASVDETKVYDGRPFARADVEYVGFQAGEGPDSLGGASVLGGTAQGSIAAGEFTLIAAGQTSRRYDVTYVGGTLLVKKAPLIVTVIDALMRSGGQLYAGGSGVTYSGFVNGETPSVLGGTIAYGGTSQGAGSVGVYTLTASGLTSPNYAFTYVGGTLTISDAYLASTPGSLSPSDTLGDDNAIRPLDPKEVLLPIAPPVGAALRNRPPTVQTAGLGGSAPRPQSFFGPVGLLRSDSTGNYPGPRALAPIPYLLAKGRPGPVVVLTLPFASPAPQPNLGAISRRHVDAVPVNATTLVTVRNWADKVEFGVVSADAGGPIDPAALPRSIWRQTNVFIIKGGVNLGEAFILAE